MTVLDLAKRWAEPARILIVEDEADSVKALRAAFSRYNCEIEVVSTLTEALHAVYSTHFDLVVIDLGMTEGSGADVVKAIKAERPSTPVLVVVGEMGRRWLEEVSRCGVVTVLRKPFDLAPQQISSALAMFKLKVGANSFATATA